MRTEVIAVDAQRPDPAALARAAAVLREGGLVAFPTETVYGLGARADSDAAVRRVFAAKGRPSFNPLIAHVATVDHARRLAAVWPPLADRLAARFWPGPLTLVVPRAPASGVCDSVTGGGSTVAVRVPSHPVALALLGAVDFAVAAPSANRFQQLSPTTAAHVLKGLDGRVDLVLDGGPTPFGIESTVVDVSADPPRLLRHGSLAYDLLRMSLPSLTVVDGPAEETGEALASPGMIRRHYAPRAALVRATGDALDRTVAALLRDGVGPVGVVRLDGAHAVASDAVVWRSLPRDAEGYARSLFAVLHALDDLGCARIVVEDVPDDAAWAGVRDRLARAAEAP